MTPLPQAPDDDLAWLALRYVAGELDPEASAAFEHRLDRDQPAREAVAEAVALIAGVVHAVPALRSARLWKLRTRRAVTAAVALAACLALAVAPRLVAFRRHGNAPVVRTPAPGGGAAVALAWSGLQQEAALTPRPDDSAAALDDLEADTVTPIETAAHVGEQIEGLPTWLIEAVALHPSS